MIDRSQYIYYCVLLKETISMVTHNLILLILFLLNRTHTGLEPVGFSDLLYYISHTPGEIYGFMICKYYLQTCIKY